MTSLILFVVGVILWAIPTAIMLRKKQKTCNRLKAAYENANNAWRISLWEKRELEQRLTEANRRQGHEVY